jgi:hypothetical protein
MQVMALLPLILAQHAAVHLLLFLLTALTGVGGGAADPW